MKFPTFYGTTWFITIFTTACHLSLSWAKLNWLVVFHPISLTAILVFFSFLQVYLLTPCVCLSTAPHVCHLPFLSHPPWFEYPNNIWWGIQNTELSIMQFCIFSIFACTLHTYRLSPPSTVWGCAMLLCRDTLNLQLLKP